MELTHVLAKVRRYLYWRLWHFLARIPVWRTRQKKLDELAFWTDQWDSKLRQEFWNPDISELLRGAGEWDTIVPDGLLDYSARRRMEARAQVIRILNESSIEDRTFFTDKIVMEIGPGAVGFLESCGARVGIGIEPLAPEFQRHGLILPSQNTLYLTTPAENIPMLDGSVDIVVSRNSLDHVEDPFKVMNEIYRLLAPGGWFLLIVDMEHQPTITEPWKITNENLEQLLSRFERISERVLPKTEMSASYRSAGVYRKRRSV